MALWRADYNTARPHSQIAWQTPVESPAPSIRDGRSRCATPRLRASARRFTPAGHDPRRKRTQHWIET
ncbi:MAG: transposase, partial [Mesorhizobium sp.]